MIASRPGPVYNILIASIEEFLQELEEHRRWKTAVNWLRQRFWDKRLIAATTNEDAVPSRQWGEDNFVTIAMREGIHSTAAIEKGVPTVKKSPLFICEDELFAMLNGSVDEINPSKIEATTENECVKIAMSEEEPYPEPDLKLKLGPPFGPYIVPLRKRVEAFQRKIGEDFHEEIKYMKPREIYSKFASCLKLDVGLENMPRQRALVNAVHRIAVELPPKSNSDAN